ncbi:MAG: dihydrolipoyllysine-residue acetyltransferase [Alteromonadaceae bacterium]|nr:MAG: dihydrolipoyllysine-residue acetyltransferase [Alteromonadaceae bacterium]
MGKQTIKVPDLGGAENVDVIEICVAVGDVIEADDALVVVESEKSSMDIPSPIGGKVVAVTVNEGDKVSEGAVIVELETEGVGDSAPENSAAEAAPAAPESVAPAPVAAAPAVSAEVTVNVPDIGGAEGVEVIEISVAVGDVIAEDDSIVVLESDKSSMDIPAPASGTVLSISVSEGDKVSQGDAILVLSSTQAATAAPVPAAPAPVATPAKTMAPAGDEQARPQTSSELHPQEILSPGSEVYAGPSTRKLAREMGVDLKQVQASGSRGRVSKDDLKGHVKKIMTRQAPAAVTGGAGIPAIPAVDFSKFGEVELVKMSKIHKLTAANMSRNWLNVPHVTQFDNADITEMEAFRKGMKAEAEKAGVKLTPMPFLLKACAAALRYERSFNVSLHSDGEHLVKKNYVNIGVAVATPNGLVVPVIRDVDKKGLYELAEESVALAKKARDGKLMPRDMQGGCFTISSLGAIGGTGFTPIVNAPEVAILGVSKASIQPVWDGSAFQPRQMLPLCLSYDHRAINGADAGNFLTYLSAVLGDVRKLLV